MEGSEDRGGRGRGADHGLGRALSCAARPTKRERREGVTSAARSSSLGDSLGQRQLAASRRPNPLSSAPGLPGLACPSTSSRTSCPCWVYADDVIAVLLTLLSVVCIVGEEPLRRHWPGTPAGLGAIAKLTHAGPRGIIRGSAKANGVGRCPSQG